MRRAALPLGAGPRSRFMATEIGRHRGPLARLAGWSVIEALPPLLSGQLVARALDRGFVSGHPSVGVAYLLVLCALYVVAAQATRRCYPPVAAIVEPLRDVLLRRVVDATLRRAMMTGRSDLAAVSQITQQVETVRDVTAGLLLVLRRVVVTISAALVGLLLLDTAIALLVVPPLVLSIAAFGIIMITLAQRRREVVLADERIAASASTVVDSVRDVVACGAERHVRDTVGVHIDRALQAATTLARATSLRIPIVAFGTYVPVILILLAAPSLRSDGLATGELLGAIVYVTTSLEPALRALVQTIGSTGLRLAVALQRLTETSTLPASPPRQEPVAALQAHDIELVQVTFAYGTRAEPVIRNLSLTIPAGEHLAIVGPSGIGKSTLANLLAGVDHPQSGTIHIGGLPITGLDQSSLHSAIAFVPQEAYVFAGTLWENLTYLRPDAPPSEVTTVLNLFGLDPLSARLGGYHNELSPATLSAGERQLVALARAYLSTRPITILDEATCHLDPLNEARAEETFAAKPGTLIVIAHRVSSARRARRILLMGDNDPQSGPHESLLGASALYRDLVGLWDDVPV